MQTTIKVPNGYTGIKDKVYQRRAWTGGDTPPSGFVSEEFHRLVAAFYNEMLAECGGLEFWECAGTTITEREQMLINRARLDAWRTLNP